MTMTLTALPTPPEDRSSTRFQLELADMEAVVDSYVRQCHDWYQVKKRSPRRVFYTTSILVITLSAVITLISAREGAEYRLTVGIIGVIITVASGINTLLRTERAWQTYALAQFNLEYLLRKWDLKISEAKYCTEEAQALGIARKATEEIIEEAKKVRGGETEEFFRNISARPK
jgi:hypothetical protein